MVDASKETCADLQCTGLVHIRKPKMRLSCCPALKGANLCFQSVSFAMV